MQLAGVDPNKGFSCGTSGQHSRNLQMPTLSPSIPACRTPGALSDNGSVQWRRHWGCWARTTLLQYLTSRRRGKRTLAPGTPWTCGRHPILPPRTGEKWRLRQAGQWWGRTSCHHLTSGWAWWSDHGRPYFLPRPTSLRRRTREASVLDHDIRRTCRVSVRKRSRTRRARPVRPSVSLTNSLALARR